jgi:ABC-2 type transport system ATP-binding protein
MIVEVPAVSVTNVSKSYGDRAAVRELSFTVGGGEIFGLIGPNGAGKTTTIRMIMDIIAPDAGEVMVLGEKAGEGSRENVGYLPEERGLYRKLTVLESLIYLATLKGMNSRAAGKKAEELLGKTDMAVHARKKIGELSKGMGQIIQFLVAIIHDPQVVILDEPFSGLDPVNTETLKGLCAELRRDGKAVILSAHQMNQVEELCDRILMVHKGRAVLYGSLREIKARYRSHSVIVECEGELGPLTGVTEARARGGRAELTLDPQTSPQQVLAQLVRSGAAVNRFEVATPSLNQIFLGVVDESNENNE